MEEFSLDVLEVINTVNQIFITADSRNWDACLNLFIEEPEINYSSFTGNPAAKMKSSELINTWKNFLPGFDHTMHFITNQKVTIHGDTAACFSYLTALHVIKNADGGESWTLYGTYDHELERNSHEWKVSKMRLNFIHQEGNQKLPEIAAGRMKT